MYVCVYIYIYIYIYIYTDEFCHQVNTCSKLTAKLRDLFVSSLFYFGKKYTILIETILYTLSKSYKIKKSKLAMALTESIYIEGFISLLMSSELLFP